MTTMRQVAVALVAAGLVVTGYGVDLCDYRTPTTDFLQGTMSFFYQHSDDPATPGPDTSTGWLTLDAQRQYSTVREGFALGGSGELRFHNLSLARASVSTAGTLRQYVGTALPYFTFGGFEASLNTAHPQPRLEAQAGLGYGRFYDVTPLAKALRIEERLIARGTLAVTPPDAVVLAMAEAIGQPDEAVPVGERVTAVVRLVEGELKRDLDAAAVLMIEEIIAAKGQERFCGWMVQAGMAYELLDPRGGPRDFLLSLALDAALAPEPNTQLLFKAKIAGPHWIADQHTLTLDVTFDHRLNDITDFRTRYTLRQDKPRGQAPAGTQSAVFHLRFNLGWIGVALQMEFSKVAEAPAWTQNVVITATADLW
jgi:hypothetical protein